MSSWSASQRRRRRLARFLFAELKKAYLVQPYLVMVFGGGGFGGGGNQGLGAATAVTVDGVGDEVVVGVAVVVGEATAAVAGGLRFGRA